jgi:hypothetical protein
MKSAASYLYRPAMVRAIQLPPKDEDPTTEWTDSLHELLEPMEWESGKNATLAIFAPMQAPLFAEPGDWIVRTGKMVRVYKPRAFQEVFMDANLSSDHRALEQERYSHEKHDLQHVTTP